MSEFNRDALIEPIARQLKVDPLTLQLSPIATGKHNTSFWITAGQDRWVLRVAPPDATGLLFYERYMMRQEPALHDLIRSRTTIPVAEILVADFSRTQFERDYVLMTVLPGVPLSEGTFLDVQQQARVLNQVGTYLQQLHTLTAIDCLSTGKHGYIGLHHPMKPQDSWTEAFHLMWNRLLDDVVASGCYTEGDRQSMSALLNHHIDHFNHAPPPCLLHMDVWAQNILVDQEGNVTGLVDFDRALWGDPEIEFAVLDYCGISKPEFWQGYGQERDSSPSAQIRQRFYLLYEVQKYMPISIWRRQDPERALSFKQKSFILAERLLA